VYDKFPQCYADTDMDNSYTAFTGQHPKIKTD